MAELAIRSLRKFSDIRVEILGERHMQKYRVGAAGRLKFRLFEEFPEAEQIVYFDSDIVFLGDPKLERILEDRSLLCVRDGAHKPWVRKDADRIGMDPEDYFNSGFFAVAAERHAEVMALARSLSPISRGMFNDQTELNWACHLLGVDITYLDGAYNHMEFFLEDPSRTIVGHLIGHNLKHLGYEELEALYEHWMDR